MSAVLISMMDGKLSNSKATTPNDEDAEGMPMNYCLTLPATQSSDLEAVLLGSRTLSAKISTKMLPCRMTDRAMHGGNGLA